MTLDQARRIERVLPIALGLGAADSSFRSPMAIAVIGGVVSSTILSLVVVPVFYLAVENLKARVRTARGLPPRSLRAPAIEPAE